MSHYRLSGSVFVFAIPIALAGAMLWADDCNHNGIDDADDLVPAQRGFVAAVPSVPLGFFNADAILCADLDADGDADLVVADDGFCNSSHLVTVLNRGGALELQDEYTVGVDVRSLLGADLNADSLVDLVTVNKGDCSATAASVSVRLNRGGGQLAEAATYEVVAGLLEAQAIDVDGDGDLDLVTANCGGRPEPFTVSMLRNDGDGMFLDAVRIVLDAEGVNCPVAGRTLAAADFDGDGDPDLATRTGSLLINSGGGAFEVRAFAAIARGAGRSIVAGDLDRDGHPDLVVAHDVGISVFISRGDGTFDDPVDFESSGREGLLCADLDADGAPDLAATNCESVLVYLNNGSGTLARSAEYAEYPAFNCDLSAHDLDGDGDLDLVTAAQDGAAVLLNRGDGSFEPPAAYIVPGVIAVADVTGDDRLDIVGAGAELSIAANEGDGTFRAVRFLTEAGSAAQVLAADFDGNGTADLLTNWGTLLAGVGDGSFEHRESGFEGFSTSETRLVPADLDEDGDIDLVAYPYLCCGIAYGILANDGSGYFEDWGGYGEGGVTSIAVADVDGDRHLDVVSALPDSSALMVLPGFGDGFFDSDGQFPVPLSFTPEQLIAEDLDQDGRVDLAVASGASLQVLRGLGGAEFDPGPIYDLGIPPPGLGAGSDFLGTADLDRDRLPELIVGLGIAQPLEGCVNGLRLLRNRGDAGFEIAPESDAPYRTRSLICSLHLATADLDGDLDVDLAVSSGTLWNRGDAVFDQGTGHIPTFASWLAAADLDADGRNDIAAATFLGIALLFNDGVPPVSVDRDRDGIPDECGSPSFHRGDVDGNAMLDISDPIGIFGWLFLGDDSPTCLEAADVQNDGEVDISDGIALLGFLFLGAPPPAPPGPPEEACGTDPDPPGSSGDIGCEIYEHCGP
jgi:hypothetical protein